MHLRSLKAIALAALFIALASVSAASAAAQTCSPLSNGERCEAESWTMQPSDGWTVWGLSTKNTSGGALAMLTRNGSATLTANLPYTDTLTVRARGGQYCHGWPHMTLTVDGRQTLSRTVSQLGWQSYPAPVTLAAGSHSISVAFDNDYSDSTCDRNLRLDFVDAKDPPLTAQTSSAFRAFAASSPWNVPAAQKGTVTSGNPYAGQFTSYASELQINGTPDNPDYASPTFFASAGDPTTANVRLTTDWSPSRDLAWDKRPIPVPAGAYPAPGSDGHMSIVSADRTKAWEFWRCTGVSNTQITAAVVAQWDLTGAGYSAFRGDSTARASGTPLISTTLRADEALHGIDHALGITVPSVASDYVYPVATHSDGSAGSSAPKYGMLFVLRADYPVPANASIGVRNVIQALKTYGAYVVDKGASFEIDADSTHPELWSQTGVNMNVFSITPSDMRLVNLS